MDGPVARAIDIDDGWPFGTERFPDHTAPTGIEGATYPTQEAMLAAFRAMGTRVGDMVAAWTDFFERFDMEKYGSEGAPLHDPCTIAYLIQPDLFAGRQINVEIETGSDLTLGMTVADWWRITDRPKNAMFMKDIDAGGFYDLLANRLARL